MYGLALGLIGIGAILGACNAPWGAFIWTKIASLLCLGGAIIILWREEQ